MDCQKARKNFSLYYDEQLTPSDKMEIEKHLSSCNSCAQEYLLWKENISKILEIPDYSVPNHLWLKIKDRIQRNRQRSKTFLFLISWRWAWVSIFIILILSSGLFINYKRNQQLVKNAKLADFLINDLKISTDEIMVVQNFSTVYDFLLEENDYLIDYLGEETEESLLEFLGKGGETDEAS